MNVVRAERLGCRMTAQDPPEHLHQLATQAENVSFSLRYLFALLSTMSTGIEYEGDRDAFHAVEEYVRCIVQRQNSLVDGLYAAVREGRRYGGERVGECAYG